MDDTESGSPRRRFLYAAGSTLTVALAGCAGDDENIDEEELPERPEEGDTPTREPGFCLAELDQEVPESLRTAESVDGVQRDPADLVSKETAGYQCSPNGSDKCTSCRYFIEGGGIDGPSACARVEGLVRTTDWCELHERAVPVDEALEGEGTPTETPSTNESTAE